MVACWPRRREEQSLVIVRSTIYGGFQYQISNDLIGATDKVQGLSIAPLPPRLIQSVRVKQTRALHLPHQAPRNPLSPSLSLVC